MFVLLQVSVLRTSFLKRRLSGALSCSFTVWLTNWRQICIQSYDPQTLRQSPADMQDGSVPPRSETWNGSADWLMDRATTSINKTGIKVWRHDLQITKETRFHEEWGDEDFFIVHTFVQVTAGSAGPLLVVLSWSSSAGPQLVHSWSTSGPQLVHIWSITDVRSVHFNLNLRKVWLNTKHFSPVDTFIDLIVLDLSLSL